MGITCETANGTHIDCNIIPPVKTKKILYSRCELHLRYYNVSPTTENINILLRKFNVNVMDLTSDLHTTELVPGD